MRERERQRGFLLGLSTEIAALLVLNSDLGSDSARPRARPTDIRIIRSSGTHTAVAKRPPSMSTTNNTIGPARKRRHATMKTFGRISKPALTPPRSSRSRGTKAPSSRKSSVSSGDQSALVASAQQQHQEYDGPMTRRRARRTKIDVEEEDEPAHLPSCSYSDTSTSGAQALVTPPSPQSFMSTGTTDLRVSQQNTPSATGASSPARLDDVADEDAEHPVVESFLDRLEARLERSLETARARDKYSFDFESGAPLADGPIEWMRVLPS